MSEEITPQMTVQEVNRRWPACRAVFDRHGMGGCGGPLGPPEPLSFFAAAHDVPLERLLFELRAAARGEAPAAPAAPPAAPPAEAPPLYRPFIRGAILLTLLFGALTGVVVLTQIAWTGSFEAPYYPLIQAHGHAQLFGWVGLFIMGVAYYVLPRFANAQLRDPRLAHGAFLSMTGGILLRALGQTLPALPGASLALLLSGAMELLAIAVFVYQLAELRTSRSIPRRHYEKYIETSLGFFLLLGLYNAFLVHRMAAPGGGPIPEASKELFLHWFLMGFVALMIFGVSLHILPVFLGLRPARVRLTDLAFYLLLGGLLLRVGGPTLGGGALAGGSWGAPLGLLASTAEALGGALFLLGLRLFEPPAARVSVPGVDPSFAWFIRLAYGWFALSLLMSLLLSAVTWAAGSVPAHAYTGAYRHALTVGFITTMILGVAYRVVPIFGGTTLRSPRAMRASFYLLAGGNLLRVGAQSLTPAWGTPAFALMGLSGYLEFAALALFGWNLWTTLGGKEPAGGEEAPGAITPDSRVRALLRARPELREVLAEVGFTPLRDPAHAAHIPPFITLRQAAAIHGLDVRRVVEALTRAEKEKVR